MQTGTCSTSLLQNISKKLLLGFQWPVIFKPETAKWICYGIWKYKAVIAASRSAGKYDVLPQNGDCGSFIFWKQSPLSKRIVVTKLSMEISASAMLSNVGCNKFKRMVVFCTLEERGGGAKTLHKVVDRTEKAFPRTKATELSTSREATSCVATR
jgi:hypothetical protein